MNPKIHKIDEIQEKKFVKTLFNLRKILFNEYDYKSAVLERNMICPACKSDLNRHHHNIFFLEYVECLNCKTIFLVDIVSKDFHDRYCKMHYTIWHDAMPDELYITRKKTIFLDRINFIKQSCQLFGITNPSSILDIGGGNLIMAELIIENNIAPRVHVIEKNCLNKPNNTNIVIYDCYLQEYPSKRNIHTKKEIVACLFEVIEHVRFPDEFFNVLYDALESGALLFFSTPNTFGFDMKYLGEHSPQFQYDHVSLYNIDSIKFLLERFGFQVLLLEANGFLDVQNVERFYMNFNDDYLFKYIISTESIKNDFQKFLQLNNLSSAMRGVAMKV
jgi:2-polyprenyl-3-methyl-5-hydroxy-6-metoxy-1,4-benzoquinol methylase